MSADTVIVVLIGVVAFAYVAFIFRRSAKKLLAVSREEGEACNSCSGCGTSKGHAASESECTVRSPLVVLGEKS